MKKAQDTRSRKFDWSKNAAQVEKLLAEKKKADKNAQKNIRAKLRKLNYWCSHEKAAQKSA